MAARERVQVLEDIEGIGWLKASYEERVNGS